MLNFSEITLIIPTHNRHGYLKRILSYYNNISIPIIIADSTLIPFVEKIDNEKIHYCHYPDIILPQKIKKALEQVETEFVVMCADDDFIIPEGIKKCIGFLKENKDFIAAQGNNISYKKQKNYDLYIELNPMYLNLLSFEIVDEDAFDRLRKIFDPYRTIFSAVHYTRILKIAFENLSPDIRNLYLNEYLTAIIPILSGFYKELNIFYQVREFSWTSDDKTTNNLDVILFDEKYDREFNSYLHYLSNIAFKITNVNFKECSDKIYKTLHFFSKQIAKDKENMKKSSLTKKIGNLITFFPILGENIVIKRRLKQQRREIAHVVKNLDEKRQLDQVINCIKTFAIIVDSRAVL